MSSTVAYEEAAVLTDPALFGVYVHVPFCQRRCHYCDFVTYTGMEGLRRPYAAALLAEADLAIAEQFPAQAERPTVTSVFVGGGTPTLLPVADLARLLAHLRAQLPFAPDAEVTVEANPETVTLRVALALVKAGVNRVSIGVQSFDDRVLQALGRGHDARRPAEALRALRAAARDAATPRSISVNLDLIYGCPGEDEASWARTLEAAVALQPDHLSAYALTIEPATKFGRLVAAGRMAEPDEDLLADRYQMTCEVLRAAGYQHCEVSNWARPGHACRHNRTYWRRGHYLGLGAGAHEFTGETRRWNTGSVPGYLAAVRAGRRPTAGEEVLSAAQARFEALALRLRTSDGLSGAEARALGVDPAGAEAATLRAAGLLAPADRQGDPGLRLTEQGMYLHGEVVSRLAPA